MNIKVLPFVLLSFSSRLVMATTYAPVQIIVIDDAETAQIAAIDQKIAALRVRRNQARHNRDTANRAADRLITRDWIGYRRQLALADQFNHEIEQLDAQIKELEMQKQQLLK
jgi:hypothetical protein